MEATVRGLAECPDCQGEERAITKYHNAACATCADGEVNRDRVREIVEAFEDGYSGHGQRVRDMDRGQMNRAWLGVDGQKYRRLMKWWWENPPEPVPEPVPVRRGKPLGRKKLFPPAKKQTIFPELPPLPARTDIVFAEFEVVVGELKAALAGVIKAVERESVIPRLSHVWIKADEGAVTLTATNLRATLVRECGARVMLCGEMVVSAYRLRAILRTVGEADVLNIVVLDNDWVEIRCGQAVWKLATMPVKDFPNRNDGPAEWSLD